MSNFPRFILASRSPRRCKLLREAGYHFDVIAPTVSEPAPNPHTKPSQLAQAAAYFKAKSVWEDHPDQIVLAADTIVAVDGQIYGKPTDQADARRILSALSGKRQAVITGVAILFPDDQMQAPRRMIASETTYVTFKQLSPQEIEKYIASGQWKDKAGAYGIQDPPTADEFVESIEGSFSNVVGLPMELIERMFKSVKEQLKEKN
ncbi:septum formation protein Maf [candidate division KSB1 bacterium]|nr:MAG: septum formation protein Maf [candidate division KSB1 bacterium]